MHHRLFILVPDRLLTSPLFPLSPLMLISISALFLYFHLSLVCFLVRVGLTCIRCSIL